MRRWKPMMELRAWDWRTAAKLRHHAGWIWIAFLVLSGSVPAQAQRAVEIPIGKAGEVDVARDRLPVWPRPVGLHSNSPRPT